MPHHKVAKTAEQIARQLEKRAYRNKKAHERKMRRTQVKADADKQSAATSPSGLAGKEDSCFPLPQKSMVAFSCASRADGVQRHASENMKDATNDLDSSASSIGDIRTPWHAWMARNSEQIEEQPQPCSVGTLSTLGDIGTP